MVSSIFKYERIRCGSAASQIRKQGRGTRYYATCPGYYATRPSAGSVRSVGLAVGSGEKPLPFGSYPARILAIVATVASPPIDGASTSAASIAPIDGRPRERPDAT